LQKYGTNIERILGGIFISIPSVPISQKVEKANPLLSLGFGEPLKSAGHGYGIERTRKEPSKLECYLLLSSK